MRKFLFLLVLLVISSGCVQQNETGGTTSTTISQETQEKTEFYDKLPTIFDIGINLGPWDSGTNMAGDVSFGGFRYEDRIFIEFGGDMAGSPNVHPTFILPLGTEIHAVSDGTVSWSKLWGKTIMIYALNVTKATHGA